MLTYVLSRLSPAMFHRILGWMRIELEIFHEVLPGFCTCGATS